jgi:hypothetical protein
MRLSEADDACGYNADEGFHRPFPVHALAVRQAACAIVYAIAAIRQFSRGADDLMAGFIVLDIRDRGCDQV